MEAIETFDPLDDAFVVIRHELVHKFEAKPPPPAKLAAWEAKGRKGKKPKPSPGCAICGEAKTRPKHMGHPPTFNDVGSGDRHFYRHIMEEWKPRWIELLEPTPLPKPCGYIFVTGTICFPTKTVPDQGNYRAFVEKTLGDALQDGGWLIDDNWAMYEFGRLEYLYSRGESWIELVLHPHDEPRVLAGLDPK